MKSRRDYFFENFWRYITNIWTFASILVVLLDFFGNDQYHYLVTPFSVIYGSLLSIFVGTKEFNRWFERNDGGRHPGELFVAVWSALFMGLAIASFWMGSAFTISPDVTSIYIMVLMVFAITQSSKQIHLKKRKRK
ncbi:MAG: hypothetical protein WC099_00690 [Candidatus Paceibacterota bacterium]